ncbi:hypothetical protein [uncultured Duncaniella sp.]|uniref:hypothetical protein n=1 Tax=uncultured Duncaniella sp. TaxID=2768039 RepID=UPI0026F3C5E8|nr:hypothetical protein [uncultured Duncaniella sp.]
MSLHNTDIQGNANISRNANVGSHANVNGDVVVGHNLFVKGWVDAPNIKGPCKGLYASEEALKAAYPRPMPGWFALVGNTLPAQVWRTDGGQWVPTGETGGQFNLWLDQLQGDMKEVTDDVRDLEELLDNGLLLGETITFTSTGAAAAMTFNVMLRDGTIKPYSKPIPIVTAEKAGMMSAADKKELSAATSAIATINEKIKSLNEKIATLESNTTKLREDLNKEIADREAGDSELATRIYTEAVTRSQKDAELQALIDKLRLDFDTMYGADTSEKIDNFVEVLAFLDGLNDSEKLSTKLADLSGADKKMGEDILELQNEVFPLSVEFSATPATVKASQSTSIHLSWGAERRKKDVTAEAEVILDGTATTGKTKDVSVNLAHGAKRTFTLAVSFEGLTETVSRTVKGTHPTYFGTVAKTWEGSEANIKALAEIIAGERSLTRTGIATNDGKIALAYPKDFGALTSVKDGNGYEVLASYTRSEVTVNGIQYYLYLLTVPVTASGVTQIYK